MAKIGLIADTHDVASPWAQALARVTEAFEGVELILHCGDLTTTQVLDDLGRIAPVVAVRSAGDPAPAPPRLVDGPHVLEAHGVVIGVINSLGDSDPAASFGRMVDVVVHGGTHEASLDTRGQVLMVNPGSPTLATELTVGILRIEAQRAEATIIPL